MKFNRFVQSAAFAAAVACGLGVARVSFADNGSATLDQSQANRLSIFHDYSIDALGSTQQSLPNVSDGGLVGPTLEKYGVYGAPVPEKNWFVSASPVLGYDSNPEGRQLAVGSVYVGMDVNAIYRSELVTETPTPVFFSLDMVGGLYEGMVKQANVIQPTAAMGIRHSFFDDTIVLSGELRDQLTLENGDAFLNSLDVVPAVEAFWFPQFSTEVKLDYAHMEYFFPVSNIQDPDTERSTLEFNLHLYPLPQGKDPVISESPDVLTDILRQSLHSVVMGFHHVWNKADGLAYQYESNRIVFGLEGIRPLKSRDLTMNLMYAHEWQDYTGDVRPDADAIIPGASIRRKDHLDTLTFRADGLLADLPQSRGTVAAFFQWDWVRDFSFIPERDFNEFVVSGGITYRY